MNWSRVIATDLWNRLRSGRALPPTLADVLPESSFAGATSEAEVIRVLRPVHDQLARWALLQVAEATRAAGARPAFALIPMPYDPFLYPKKDVLLGAAREAGCLVIDMQDTFEDLDRDDYILNNADYHPNTAGHRVIADRLYAELLAQPGILAPAP